jgi:replication factor A1
LRRVDTNGTVIAVLGVKTVNLKTGGEAKLGTYRIRDESGASILLNLWDDQTEGVEKGSVLSIANGYTTSFKGEVYLNVGKYGKLTKA